MKKPTGKKTKATAKRSPNKKKYRGGGQQPAFRGIATI